MVSAVWLHVIFLYIYNLFNSTKLAHSSKLVSVVSPRLNFRSLLLKLHINDLPNASKLTQPLLVTDDTSIFYSHQDLKYLESILNDELYNLDIWTKCNKLSVNIKKISYIIFKSR